jgi:Zn-dependent alcohol dehydrogenase
MPQQLQGVIVRSKGAPVEPMLIDHCLEGRLPLDAFVSEDIGIGDIEAAFDKMHGGQVLRSVVVMEHADRPGSRGGPSGSSPSLGEGK